MPAVNAPKSGGSKATMKARVAGRQKRRQHPVIIVTESAAL